MQILTAFSVCVLASLVECATLSDYLRFIPKFGKVDRHDAQEWPPKFCNGLDCPKFRVRQTVKGEFEVRQYDASQWVSTNSAGVDYSAASRTNFMRLFNYISGNNTSGKKIAMTAPVITRIIPGAGPACETNFTMSFYVALDDPPHPTDSNVFLQKLRPLKAYVRSFGGYDMYSIKPWLKQAAMLDKYLGNTTYTYNHEFYYIGGYDSPFKFLNRHNEVWFLANDDKM